jgi:hypothetical protein
MELKPGKTGQERRLRAGTWGLLNALLAPGLLAAAQTIPADKSVIELTPKFGPVTFAHQRHSELDGVDCVTCHHMTGPSGEGVRSCYSCHKARLFQIARIRKAEPVPEDDGSESGVPDAQEAFHGLCTGCHHHRRSEARPAGPDDSCRDCHK